MQEIANLRAPTFRVGIRYNAAVTKQYFTLEEARQLLPRIKQLMGRAVLLTQQMREFETEVRKLAQRAVGNSGGAAGTAYLDCLLALRQTIEEVQGTGCLVKSIEEGLVDFPHWMKDREVCLCWRHGEEDIRFWHEVEAGFAGRHPIEE